MSLLDAVRAPADAAPAPRRRLWPLLLALAVAGALAWVLLASSLLAVDRVVVTGTGRTTPAQVQAAAAVVPGTPLARVDVDGVRRRVLALDPVADVVVERAWPSRLRLRVVERRAEVGFLTQGRYVLIDGDAVPFAREPRLPAGAVRLQVARPAADDPATRAALAVLAEVPATLRARVGIVRASTATTVALLLKDGRTVVWGSPGRAADKGAAAEALLRLPGSVYDVTSPDVVVRRQAPGAGGVAPSPEG